MVGGRLPIRWLTGTQDSGVTAGVEAGSGVEVEDITAAKRPPPGASRVGRLRRDDTNGQLQSQYEEARLALG